MTLRKILGLERKLAIFGTLGTLSAAIPSSVFAQEQQRGPPPVTAQAGFEFFLARGGEIASQYNNRWFSNLRANLFEIGKFHAEVGIFLGGTNRLFVELPKHIQTFHEHFGGSLVYSPINNLSFNLSYIRFNTDISNSPLINEKGERPSGGAYDALSSGLRYAPNERTSLTGELSFHLLDKAYIGRTRFRFIGRTRIGQYNIEASLHRIEHGVKQQTYYNPFYPWQISIGHRIPGTNVEMNITYGDRNFLDLQENKPQPRNVPLRTLTIGAAVKAPYSSRNP
jgi:hypothetical protein